MLLTRGGGRHFFALFALALLACCPTGSAEACTSFCFDTPDGPVFGANMDLRWGDGLVFVNRRGLAKEGYYTNASGQHSQWIARYGSVTFSLVGLEMPWGGMNEAGLTASTMKLAVTGFPAEDERYAMSSPTWVQYMLDTCASVEEVIAAQDSVRVIEDDAHFLIADATGACVVVEYLDAKTIVYAGDDLPVRALANGMYHDGLGYIETGAVPSFNPGASAQRMANAAKYTAQWDPQGEIAATDWALGVLTEAVVDPKSWWKDLFNEPYTRWSIAYDIARREIHFRTEASPTVRRISLASFDFACGEPALMMDVNAGLEGAVDRALQPYDAEWNFEFCRKFLDRWRPDISEEGVVALVEYLESFECAP